jgi:competence protein ComEC
MNVQAGQLLKNILPSEWESRDIWVEGYIDGLPSLRISKGYGTAKQQPVQRFEFVVHSAQPVGDSEISLPMHRLRLNWYGQSELLQPATRWRLRVRLKRPHGLSNPGGGDYLAYLLAHDIHAVGYVRRDRHNTQIAGSELGAYHHRWRSWLRQRLHELQIEVHHGLILALGIGDRSELDSTHKTVLRDSGTAHLLAISGLHIGFVAFLCYLLGANLSRLSTQALLLAPAMCWGAMLGLLGASLYALLAGFPLPTRRALIMVSVAMSAVLFRRRLSFSAGFCIALALVLSLQPLAGHMPGFWLSFGAVLAILLSLRGSGANYLSERQRFGDTQTLLSRHMAHAQNWILQMLHTQYAVSVALIVPLGVFFHAIPIWSFVANLFAIPLVSMAVVPLILLGFALLHVFPEGARPVFWLSDQFLDLLLTMLQAMLALPGDFRVWHPSAWPLWAIALAIVGSILTLCLKTWGHRLAALLLLLPLLLPISKSSDRLRMETLDIGQGLAVLIQTPNHAMLYDAGPQYGSTNAGELVILPALRFRGIRELDTMLLSHRDHDHIGGAHSVLDGIRVKRVMISAPDPDDDSAKSKLFSDAEHCHKGQYWRWDEVDFEILHPPADFHSDIQNNRSCVLLIRTGEYNILIGGDIDARTELALLPQITHLLPLNALHASHHGSQSSSSDLWVNTVNPHFVFYSTGYRNRYRHPHPAVLRRFIQAGAQGFNTATHGAILLRLDNGNQFSASSWRTEHPRLWFPQS